MADSSREGGFLRLLPSAASSDHEGGRPARADRPPIIRPFEYSSLQINLPPAIDDAIVKFAATIPDAQLAEGGRATQPHLTVKQGLMTRRPDDAVALVAGEKTFSVTFGRTHVFETADHDIVHVDVSSERLMVLHDALSTLLHRDPHASYHPHVTIAFVKPGQGAAYAGNSFLAGFEMQVRGLTYSSPDGTQVDIPLHWDEDD